MNAHYRLNLLRVREVNDFVISASLTFNRFVCLVKQILWCLIFMKCTDIFPHILTHVSYSTDFEGTGGL